MGVRNLCPESLRNLLRDNSDKRPGAKASEILERMSEFREANPDQPIPLSGEELDVLMSVDADVIQRVYGDQTNITRREFHNRLLGADSDFLSFAGSPLVSGKS